MKFIRIIILLLGGLLGAMQVQATHIVGGEFEMLYLSANNYQITMNLYFDDVNGNQAAIDADARVYIYRKTDNMLMTSLTLLRIPGSPLVPYTNPACAANATELRTKIIRYRNTIQLSNTLYNSANGYYISWERCCRNNTAANIVNPGSSGQVFYLEFPPVRRNNQSFINSSPQLFPPLSDYACVNDDFQFDFSGTDTDGDSLVYSMSAPLRGYSSADIPLPPFGNPAPYPTIAWSTGYGINNAINGAVPLQINAQSGLLKLKANQPGLYVFAIKCEEYRKGVYIGQVRRDFQLFVKDCLPNNPPSLNGVIVSGKNYELGDTIKIMQTDNRCVDITFKDKPLAGTVSQQLTLKAKAVNFNPAIYPFTLTNTTGVTTATKDSIESSICFDACAVNHTIPVFEIDITVTDNGCSLPKSVTLRLIFKIEAPINTPVFLQSSVPSTTNHRIDTVVVIAGQALTLDINGTDSQNDYLQLKSKIVKLTGNDVIATLPANTPIRKGDLNANFQLTTNCFSANNSPYIFDFIASDSSCIDISYDTLRLVVIVKEVPSVPPTLFTENISVRDTILVLRGGLSRTVSFKGIDKFGDNLSITTPSSPEFLVFNGIIFTPRTGRGQVEELLQWQPPCEYAGDTNFVVNFILTDNGCPSPQSDTVAIRFIVQYDPNNAPTSELISVVVEKNDNSRSPNDLLNFWVVPQDTVRITLKSNDLDKNQLQLKGLINDSLTIPNLGLSLTTQEIGNDLLANILWPIDCGLLRNRPYKLSFLFHDNGCPVLYTDTINLFIAVIDSADRDYTHYNITTPNGDGKNDVFSLPDLPPDNCRNQFVSIDIYNRWGVKVFSNTHRNFVWDAQKFAGGTYFYGIRYTNKKYRGWIDVLH